MDYKKTGQLISECRRENGLTQVQLAEKIGGMDIPCFACPPERLPELLEMALKKRSLKGFSETTLKSQSLCSPQE